MNFKSETCVRTVLALSVLAAISACTTNKAQDSNYRGAYNVGYDTYQRPALRKPMQALPDESQQTIQSLAARIRFLERKLAAVTGYTPDDLKAVDESQLPAERPVRSTLQAPPVFTAPEQRVQTEIRSGAATREYVQPNRYRQAPARQPEVAPTPVMQPVARPWYEQRTETDTNVKIRDGRRVVGASASGLMPVAHKPTARVFESNAPRYDLYYRFGTQEESDALINKLARTHVQPQPLHIDGQHLVQVGSFAAEGAARIRRQYLYSFVGIAPELRLHRP